jgi:D-alanine-D-alanine ligase
MKITLLAYQPRNSPKPDAVVNQVAEALAGHGHETAILTVFDNVKRLVAELQESKTDLVFNLVEDFGDEIIGGVMGVAGLLDLLGIPYTGGGPGELYLQEDKALAKKLLAYEKVLHPDFAVFAANADFETGGNLRMPLFVKPSRSDASIGIDAGALVHNTQELMERVLKIHKELGDAALAEEFIEGREFYVGVLGNQRPRVFPPVEMDFSGMPDGLVHILDNKAKFDESSVEFQGTKAVVPKLDTELRARLQKIALDAYRALRVRDYGRIDLRLTESGEIHVIEVNANCYLVPNGEFAMAAHADGIEYTALIQRIVELAIERHEQRRGKSALGRQK